MLSILRGVVRLPHNIGVNVNIFMASGLYDSPIRITKAWDDLGIAPDADGNYTVKAYAVAKNSAGEHTLTLEYIEQPKKLRLTKPY